MSKRTALVFLSAFLSFCAYLLSQHVLLALLVLTTCLYTGEYLRASWLERRAPEPTVYWLTGVSGAGKTTIGADLASELRFRGHNVQIMDGDTLRDKMQMSSFEREDIETNTVRIGHIISLLEANGVTVVATFISPFRLAREEAHNLCVNSVEVYVDAEMETVVGRDTKGLYSRYMEGDIKNLHGMDVPYEPPLDPDVHLHTDRCTPEESSQELIAALENKDLI